LIEREATVSASDLDLIKIVDTEDEVVAVIDAFYKKFDLSPNF
ncbi:MAG TPA: TIGR00730 family Rossman fold protein, partial [Flavobacterium sp.]|nr:TIGR00730 family Rossman fold protein [Flavobacterium sp.]